MKNQVAEKIYRRFWENNIPNFKIITHSHKNKALKEVYNNLEKYFNNFKKSKDILNYFEKVLPYIKKVTKFHLARNLGFNYGKPDRHLVRIAKLFNYNDVQALCKHISSKTNDSIGLVDLVFWRFANLNKNYLELIKSWK